MKEAFDTLLQSQSLPGAVVFAVTLIIGSGMALANWEFTRWGMTVNEVERASRYSAIKNGQGLPSDWGSSGEQSMTGRVFGWLGIKDGVGFAPGGNRGRGIGPQRRRDGDRVLG